MLGDKNAAATIAVKDVKRAKEFYEGKLGLKRNPEVEAQVLSYQSGTSTVFVYESQFAGSNKATAVTWIVDDLVTLVDELKSKGVVFEHYDFPGGTRQGDVHLTGKSKAAWFKDPDGNILALVGS